MFDSFVFLPLSTRAYFKGRAYIKIILKNHARSYFAGRSYYRGNTVVEASHANAYARAIAFFSYIWFKYDILSFQHCKLGGQVVSTLSSRPTARRFDSHTGCANVIQFAGICKGIQISIIFCFKTLHYS